MAITYVADAVAVEAPSPKPGPGLANLLSLPQDADGWTVANFYQALKALADDVQYIKSGWPNIWREQFMLGTPAGGGSLFSATTAPLTNYAPLSFFTNGGSLQFSGTGTFGPTRFLGCAANIATTNTNGFNSVLYGSLPIFQNESVTGGANLQMFFDTDVQIQTAQGDIWIGFTDGGAGIGAGNLFGLKRAGGAAGWTLVTGAGSVALAAGFNPVVGSQFVGTFQHVQLRCYGSNTTKGIANGAAFVEVWINGVLAATQSGAITAGVQSFPFCAVKTTGGVVGQAVFGPWTLQWNRY